MPSSPTFSTFAPVFLKSYRVASSREAWLIALSTSCLSTLLTMSNDDSLAIAFLRWVGVIDRGFIDRRVLRYCFCSLLHCVPGAALALVRGARPGRLPERPKGADCKSAGIAFRGSNPLPATHEPGPMGRARCVRQPAGVHVVHGFGGPVTVP